MISEIRQLLLKPSQENFDKLLELVRDLDADSVEIRYIQDHLKSWPLEEKRVDVCVQTWQAQFGPNEVMWVPSGFDFYGFEILRVGEIKCHLSSSGETQLWHQVKVKQIFQRSGNSESAIILENESSEGAMVCFSVFGNRPRSEAQRRIICFGSLEKVIRLPISSPSLFSGETIRLDLMEGRKQP